MGVMQQVASHSIKTASAIETSSGSGARQVDQREHTATHLLAGYG
jgi:alanyl-tRNA synthetase